MIDVLEASRYEKNIIIEKDPAQKDYYKDHIYQALSAIDAKTLELEDLTDDKGKVILNDFKTLWDDYKNNLNQIILLATKEENEKAYQISVDKGSKVREVAITQLKKLISKNENSMQDDKAKNLAAYSSTLNWIIALIVIGIDDYNVLLDYRKYFQKNICSCQTGGKNCKP